MTTVEADESDGRVRLTRLTESNLDLFVNFRSSDVSDPKLSDPHRVTPNRVTPIE